MLDVRFFVTAVLIQRDTGGNLSEILDNLAHVVRERFKIRRQVRVHTAHGRFTGYVLLALPAALAVALSFINPEHMAAAVPRAHGPDDADRRDRHADDRLRLDSPSHQDRGVAVTLLLPLLAFLFGVAAGRGRRAGAVAGRRRRRSSAASAKSTGDRVKEPAEDEPGYDRVADRHAEEDRQRGAAARPTEMGKLQQRLVDRRLPQQRSARRLLRHPARLRAARLRAAGVADPDAAEPARWRSAGCGARLPAAEHGARTAGQDAASIASGSGCPTRSTCWSSASKPGSASIRRFSASARSSRSRIPTCPTSCG